MINKLKKNDLIFFILKNIQLFLKRSIKKLLIFSGEDERISKIENVLINQHKKKEFSWEKMCLNGQKFRKKILEKFLDNSKFDLIVETGTEYGFTTKFLSKYCDKILTVEKSKSVYLLALDNLKETSNIKLIQNDSKKIFEILKDNDKNFNKKKIFFYLDAHSEDDYPLIDELNFIIKHVENFVILIDDFQVPDDDGYGYDSFQGKKLNIKFIKNILINNLSLFFPSIESSEESGRLRGYVFITNNKIDKELLNSIDELNQFNF